MTSVITGASVIRTALMLAMLGFGCLGTGSAIADTSMRTSNQNREVINEINDLLRIRPLLATMADEAVRDLVKALADRGDYRDGHVLATNLDRIYHPKRLERLLSSALERELADEDRILLRKALRFYDTPTGRRFVGLEISARRALMIPDQEAAVQDALLLARERGDARLEQIERLMIVTGVVEHGVASGLNSNVAASRGVYAAMGAVVADDLLSAEATAMEEILRADITEWVQRLLYLAYRPAKDEEVEALIAFVSSPEARALSDCLNRAFDRVFLRLSYEAGIVMGAAFSGEEL